MRRRSKRIFRRFGTSRALASVLIAAGALGSSSCGTLAGQSTGDVDLAVSFVGPYERLGSEQVASGSASRLISASNSMSGADEPSIIVIDRRRIAYMTLTAPMMGPSVIGRAIERPSRPPDSLDFTSADPLIMADQDWEGASVHSPSAVAISATEVVLAYAGRDGIGLARSNDGGVTFTKLPSPILTNGAETFDAPSLARSADNHWFMALSSNGRLLIATAGAPEGPWQVPVPMTILEPALASAPDAATAFESVALGDPALAIIPTASGRNLFALFYTATGPGALTVISAAASYDGITFQRIERPVYSDRMVSVRAGSLEIVNERTALLWIGSGAPASRVITAAIGPVLPRLPAPGS